MEINHNNKDLHVIWTVIDGCHADIFYELFAGGRLPNLCRAMGGGPHGGGPHSGGLTVRNATTCFPSVTVVCLASMFTGANFKTHGLLGNVWYDRTWEPVAGRAYCALLEQTLAAYDRRLFGLPQLFLPELRMGGLVNVDIDPEVKTIYEVLGERGLRTCAMYNYVGRGATLWLRPTRTDMLAYVYADKYKHDHSIFDRRMTNRAIRHVRRGGLPHLLVLYFGGHDGNSHHRGVGAQADYLIDVIDPLFGRLLKVAEETHPIEKLGFVLNSDHGQTDFPRGGGHRRIWVEDIIKMFERGAPGRTAAGLKVDGGEKPQVAPDADVIFAIGTGGSFSLQIKNRRTGRWTDSPRFAEDVAPVANLLLSASDPGLASEPFHVGAGCFSFIIVRENLNAPYMIYQNDPPYEGTGRLLELETFFAGKKERYPAAVEQIRGIEHPARGPDAVAVLDYDEKGFYMAGGEHRGNHGHFCPDDSRIPLVFAGPGIATGEIETGRLIDIAPTVAAMFGLPMPSADGKPLDVFTK
ncbi:MAG: alkaline phosphatase family protein [bacterium]